MVVHSLTNIDYVKRNRRLLNVEYKKAIGYLIDFTVKAKRIADQKIYQRIDCA